MGEFSKWLLHDPPQTDQITALATLGRATLTPYPDCIAWLAQIRAAPPSGLRLALAETPSVKGYHSIRAQQ